MRELEDLLQERLEQLEAGAPLEVCLAGLPEEAADLLTLSATLREVDYPTRDSEVVAAQRAHLLKLAAQQQEKPTASPPQARRSGTRLLPRWLQPLRAFSSVGALAFICATIAVAVIAIAWWSSRDTQVASVPSPHPTSEARLAQRPSASPTSQAPVVQSALPLPTVESTYHVLLPAISGPEIRDPQHATLREARGLVQVQTDAGAWSTVSTGHVIQAGQRIRTGRLSSAKLAFYDGSQARMGAETEVSVDELDAHRSDGSRVVALTQWHGETDHDVVPASAPGSRYKVRTPSATAEAKGTRFHVLVTADQLTRFNVDEGAISATGMNATVTVVAGQSTTVESGQAPSEPVFRITGEGQVTQIGATWIIAGQTFLTHDDTVIVGNPQVGDWVFVEGRLLPDDTRIADWIVLLRRSAENRFTITGRVQAIEDAAWTVAGQSIVVDDETDIEDDTEIEIGDLVRVEGVILQDGTLLAEHILLVEEQPGLPFRFTGVVQEIAEETWTISGVAITVDAETTIDEGLVAGDVVRVRGWILDDGRWLARAIRRAEEEQCQFEFTGEVESIAPWVVAGIPFETDEWTAIEPGIDIGDRVRVKGRVLEDGTWLATEIERLDQDEPVLQIVFVGTVDSIDPWVVSHIPLAVDDETIIEGEVAVGDLVKVTASILPDGTWLATRIEPISVDGGGLGCLYITAVVVGVSPDQLELLNWPPVDLEGVPVEGELTVGSVVMLLVCVDTDGSITVVHIVVIYQPEPVVPPPPPAPPVPPPPHDDQNDKVTICHKPNSKNPHTITISRSALQAHLNHGDTIGPCE